MKKLMNIIIHVIFILIVLLLGTAGTMGGSSGCLGGDEAIVLLYPAPEGPLTYTVFDHPNQNIQFNPLNLNIRGSCYPDWSPGFPFEFLIRVDIVIEWTKFDYYGHRCTAPVAVKKELLTPEFEWDGSDYTAIFNKLYEWDGSFDTYPAYPCSATGVSGVSHDIYIKVGFAKSNPGQSDHGAWMIHNYRRIYPYKYTQSAAPPVNASIALHDFFSLDNMQNFKYTMDWNEIYNADIDPIEFYFDYELPNNAPYNQIYYEITQPNTNLLIRKKINQTLSKDVLVEKVKINWDGKLEDPSTGQLQHPDESQTNPTIHMKIGFVHSDNPSVYNGPVDPRDFNISGQPWIDPTFYLTQSSFLLSPAAQIPGGDNSCFIVKINVITPSPITADFYFEFDYEDYESNHHHITGYKTITGVFEVPIIWGGYNQDILNLESSDIDVTCKYTPINDKGNKKTVMLSGILTTTGNITPTTAPIVWQYYSPISNAVAKINHAKEYMNIAFNPAGRTFTYELDDDRSDYKDMYFADIETFLTAVSDDDDIDLTSKMYLYLCDKVYEGSKEMGGVCSVDYGGIIMGTVVGTQGNTKPIITKHIIHEMGHLITHNLLDDYKTKSHNHYACDEKTYDNGCVMPYDEFRRITENSKFDRLPNPHFCLSCLEKIRLDLKYPKL